MSTGDIQSYLSSKRELYRHTLTDNILPFWIQKGLDTTHGGIYTCLDRSGQLMDSTKSVWFQGRAIYTFSYAYNHLHKSHEYLEAAQTILAFLEKHCFDQDGRMFFEVRADGTPLRKRRYVFSETFAIVGMSEYALATGDRSYALKALELFKRTRGFINTPGVLEPKYLPSQEAIGHSISMILLNTALSLKQVIEDPVLDQQIRDSFRLLHDKLYLEEFDALLEMVTPDGLLIDTLSGRTINPGHCIETAWFLLEASSQSNDKALSEEMRSFGLKVLESAWGRGWDTKYGGIINFLDVKGYPHQDYSQDMKFWWPQCEALIANLYAYHLTNEEKYLQRFKLVDEWVWSHLPDAEYPEWYGYLHRDGTVAQPAKGNLFKGPFHIPRALIKCSLIIDALLDRLK